MLPSESLKGCWWFPICSVCVIWLWIILKMFSLTVRNLSSRPHNVPKYVSNWVKSISTLPQCILVYVFPKKKEKKNEQENPQFFSSTMFRAHYSTSNNNISFQSSRCFYGMLINPFEVFINFWKWEPVIYQSKKWEMWDSVISILPPWIEYHIIFIIAYLFHTFINPNEWASTGRFFLIFLEFLFNSTYTK